METDDVTRTSAGLPNDSLVPSREVEAVVDATRVVGALIAESLAHVEPSVTMPQWRVLVLASEGGCNVSAVAQDLDVHMSNATRICDRLVAARLLRRDKNASDRRQVLLRLTPAGRRLYDAAIRYRRDRVEDALSRIDHKQRSALAAAITSFAEALGAAHDEHRSLEP
jgi:DNA-binding MarR family transcriptional regulator